MKGRAIQTFKQSYIDKCNLLVWDTVQIMSYILPAVCYVPNNKDAVKGINNSWDHFIFSLHHDICNTNDIIFCISIFRTNSDSAIHTSTMGPSDLDQMGSPTTPPAHKRSKFTALIY